MRKIAPSAEHVKKTKKKKKPPKKGKKRIKDRDRKKRSLLWVKEGGGGGGGLERNGMHLVRDQCALQCGKQWYRSMGE